ncbi:epoxyqueuosine reductase [Lutispora thermophila]|uniref:Epoxyqueuosine reductase QueG (Queuosine biosynthesis) n=1 Tax=Lutispora thermophila DSM 19022 TaxID=1122184 RepID=A0A1M6CAY6_9FIRM|nr:epoxyqueuosine reductase [Lutispora thermophila]SHI57971.1 Epoxyqueuosine reductase QueG (queuosine biosynthesis) [Lutispora thermophila DSM 19022]
MNIKDELIELIKKSVAESEERDFYRQPLIGFSSANDPLFKNIKNNAGLQHLYPQDILPEAKTVVSFFIPFSESVVSSNRVGDTVSIEWAESYVKTNKLINDISENMIDFLVQFGIKAATVKATHNFDEKTLTSGWSHRSAAYVAGLGKFGVNRMLITKAGSAGRYGTVIMSQEIFPDERTEEEYCLYYKNGSCLKCVKACPVDALSIDGFNRFQCYNRLLDISQQFTDIGLCDVCGKCVVSCPVAIIDK